MILLWIGWILLLVAILVFFAWCLFENYLPEWVWGASMATLLVGSLMVFVSVPN